MNTQRAGIIKSTDVRDITDITYDAAREEYERLVRQNTAVPLGPESKAMLEFLESVFMESPNA